MASAQQTVLRPIAEHEMDELRPGLAPHKRNDYATSAVRQWLTYDGWAMLFIDVWEFRLHVVAQPDGSTHVGHHVDPNSRIDPMLSAAIREEEIPELLEKLNICQSAHCYADYGQPLKLTLDPALGNLSIQFDMERPWRSDGQSS